MAPTSFRTALLLLALQSSAVSGFTLPETRPADMVRTVALRLHPDEGEALVAAASEYLKTVEIHPRDEESNGEDDLSFTKTRVGTRTVSGVSANGASKKKPTESFAFARTLFSRIVHPKSVAP